MAGRRAAVRLLFVALVAAGIAGMHTLGHPTSGGHGAAHSAPVATHEPAVSHLAGNTAALAASAADVVIRGLDLGLDPSSVCLAVLVAFGLAALLAALAVRHRRTERAGRTPRGVVILAGRGPPPTPAFGLRLADLSELRI